MKSKWLLLLLLLPAVLFYQNCSDMKSLPGNVNSSVEEEGGENGGGGGNDGNTCTPISPVISNQISSNYLSLSLVNGIQVVSARWTIRSEQNSILNQSAGSSTSAYSFNFSSITNCRVVVVAEFESCGRVLSIQKTIEIRSCSVVPPPPPPVNPVEPRAGCVRSYPHQITAGWFGGSRYPWPSYGKRIRLYASRNSTVSYSFTTPARGSSLASPGYGSYATGDFPEDGDGILKMTISTTEGCTNSAYLHPNCAPPPARLASVGWSLSPSQYSCPLEFGKTYYINLTYGNNSSQVDGQPFCPADTCGVDFQNQIQ